MITLTERQMEIVRRIRLDARESDWYDWRWQCINAIRDIDTFERVLGVEFPPDRRDRLEKTIAVFPLSITPYYLSLINPNDLDNDPIFKQSFCSEDELSKDNYGMEDPLAEDIDSPAQLITHRYPDRVLLHASNVCAMYCRHCTRKRKVGDRDHIPSKSEIRNAIDYIRSTPGIRDVLVSGGDPFMLSDDYLDWILSELRSIPHVEILRIGTRTPVVLPYRITDNLLKVLRKYHPLWINTHFNHPREITKASQEALRKLADAGIPLGNQSVLLAGVNDCPRIMKVLVQKLVANRVRPYYLYQCDLSKGLLHFRTPVGKGIEIIESLIGHTSGLCVPTYVIDAPGGGGKIPLLPNYLVSWSTNKVVLRNYEGVITTYKEPDSYEPVFCDRNCADCKLQLNLNGEDEYNCVGVGGLLSDFDSSIALVPEQNERVARRDQSDYDLAEVEQTVSQCKEDENE